MMETIGLIGKVLCIFMALVLVAVVVVIVMVAVWMIRDMWKE